MGFSSPLSGTAVTGTVAVSSVPPIVVESGTIDASGSTVELAAGTSVEISGTPSVDIGNTPAVTIDTSGGSVPVDATGTVTVTSITDAVSVGGTLDVQGVAGGTAIGVAGSVTVESGTIDVGNTPGVTVESGTIDIGNTPAVTVDGPVGISQGSQVVIANAGQTGQTTPSPVGSVTDGNATLSSTDYNLVSWPADSLPAGWPGNLVYDSNLAQAIAAVGPTWNVPSTFSFEGSELATIGSANGDFDVLNAGADTAEWVYYGTGSASANVVLPSQVVNVTPGATYTLSAFIDATAATAGGGRNPGVELQAPYGAGTSEYVIARQNPGVSGVVSGTVTIPGGVTQVVPVVVIDGVTVTAGATVSWSQIQFTETSTVQPYEPGPLWTYDVYRDAEGTYERIGSTTALALEDTGQAGSGQPPSVNTSNPLLSSPAAPTVTAEGTTGSTTYTYAITAQTPSAQGTVVLGANPGVTIGTIDIADGATVQIAAGTAAIGTVDLAAGASVDATIQNATLDVTGSTINVDGATQLSSSFGTVNASAQDTVTAYAGSTPDGGGVTVTLIPSPSSSERVQLFSGELFIPPNGGIHLETTSGTIISVEADNGATDNTAPSLVVPLQYDGSVLPAGEGVNAYGLISSASLNYSVIAT